VSVGYRPAAILKRFVVTDDAKDNIKDTKKENERLSDESLAVPATFVNRFQFFTSAGGETLRIGLGEASPNQIVFHLAVAMMSKDARTFANAILKTLDRKEKSLHEGAAAELEPVETPQPKAKG
jgi:hypothetical protein